MRLPIRTLGILCVSACLSSVTMAGAPGPNGEASSPVIGGDAISLPADVVDRPAAISGLLQKAEERPVRVIVRLSDTSDDDGPDSLAQRRPDISAESARVARIAELQQDVLARLGVAASPDLSGVVSAQGDLPEHVLDLRAYRFIPSLSLTVTRQGLERLIDDERVMSVQEDVPVPPTLDESTSLIEVPTLWSHGADGSGTMVAVLDTGVQSDHPFLQGKVVREACFSTNNSYYPATSLCPGGVQQMVGTGAGENCPTDVDGCSHGTHVAGIVAGANGSYAGHDIDGVAPGAEIIAIQVFSEFGPEYCTGDPSGDPCVLTFTSDQLAALDHVYGLATTESLPVASINMSLGGGEYTDGCPFDSRADVIGNLREAGVLTVIAAGNDGYDSAVNAPGCIPSAITVAASDKQDVRAGYSNWSPLVDVVAPGSSILSSIAGDGYSWYYGTSMAAPHVAGAVALYQGENAQLSADEIERGLEHHGEYVADVGLRFPRLDAIGVDSDRDQMPDLVEYQLGYDPGAKDNDVFNVDTLLVRQQYRDFLGREGQSSGISYWAGRLADGMAPERLISRFVGSTEFQDQFAPVIRMHFAALGRFPEYSGLQDEINRYWSQRSLDPVGNSLASMSEFQTRYGSLTDEEYVNQAFLDVLGRSPSSSGVTYWTDKLSSGVITRGEFMVRLSETDEYKTAMQEEVQTVMLYVGLLRRSPRESGYEYWLERLESGKDYEDIVPGFYKSADYHARFLP